VNHKKRKGRPVSVYLDDDVKDFLDAEATTHTSSRSEILNAVVRRAAGGRERRVVPPALPMPLACPVCLDALKVVKQIIEMASMNRVARKQERQIYVCARCRVRVVVQRIPAGARLGPSSRS